MEIIRKMRDGEIAAEIARMHRWSRPPAPPPRRDPAERELPFAPSDFLDTDDDLFDDEDGTGDDLLEA